MPFSEFSLTVDARTASNKLMVGNGAAIHHRERVCWPRETLLYVKSISSCSEHRFSQVAGRNGALESGSVATYSESGSVATYSESGSVATYSEWPASLKECKLNGTFQ